MIPFYAVISIVAIFMIIISVCVVLADKKKVFSLFKGADKKKQEIVEIINDADQMIEELNKFSDYIVTQMDFKNEELRANIKKADDDINRLNEKAQSICDMISESSKEVAARSEIEFKPAIVVNGTNISPAPKTIDSFLKYTNDLVIDNPYIQNNYVKSEKDTQVNTKKREKVIPINNKYMEVIRLNKSGLNEVEIAKKLKMGKGEIQLILELNK